LKGQIHGGSISRKRIDVSTFAVGFLMLVVLILSFSGVANAADLAFRAHASIFLVASAIGLAGLLGWHELSERQPQLRCPPRR